jgi:predicted nucleic acid-binding protein
MKKILIDLNVIIDFLNKRKNHKSASQVIDLCVKKKVTGYVCAHEITTLAYFLRKKSGYKKVKLVLNEIFEIFKVISVSKKILTQALLSEINDYEDAVIEKSALLKNIDFIISRNIKDFKKSRIKTISPVEFLFEIKR